MHERVSRIALAVVVLTGALAVAAPTAEALNVNVMLLLRWDGEGCIGTGTGTSISVVARDVWQASGTKTASWPGVTSATRCKGDSSGGLIQVGPVSLVKYDGYHTYRLEASITDASGTVTTFSSNQNLRVGGSCTASTYYMGTSDVHCSSTQPAVNHLGVANQRPATPSITTLYPDYPDYAHTLWISWSGVSFPLDFNMWEIHMSTTSGFTPSYSFPTTLKATRTWGTQSMQVTGLQPGTQYCFKIRNTDRYWKYSDFTTRNYPSYGESVERCARTQSDALRVTSPNGGEIWSGTHAIAWTGGSAAFDVDFSADDGASFATLASSVTPRTLAWDTRAHPDGADYRVRVRDASGNDVSDARFTIDNTPPVTTATVTGPLCNGWRNPARVTFDATDNLAGVRSTYVRENGGPARLHAGGDYEPQDGERTIEYWSDDRADAPNAEAAKSTGVIRVDTRAPETRLALGAPTHVDASAGRTYLNSSTTIALQATDAGSGVNATEYRIDGGAWTPYAGPFTLAGPDREILLEYRSTDHACHVETAQESRLFLDNTPPDVEITTPPPGSVTSGNETTAAPDILALLDEALATLPVTLPEAPVDRERVCEAARIVASGLHANGQPDAAALLEALLCASAPDAPAVVSGTVTIRAEADDPLVNGGASGMDRVRFLVDGALREEDDAPPYELVWNTTAETPGPHTVRVVALDHLGQASAHEREVLVADPNAGADLCAALPALPPELAFLNDLVQFTLDALGLACKIP